MSDAILLAVYLPHEKHLLEQARKQLGGIKHFTNVKNDGCIELWRTVDGAATMPGRQPKKSRKPEETVED